MQLVVQPKKTTLGKSHIVKSTLSVSKENSDQDSPLKRKRKSRGITETIPQISDISFSQTWTYQVFQPVWLGGSFSSFLYCVQRKRGPPLA